jgi:hypothetical protein
MLTIRAGEERPGVDFTLQVVPTARVDGTVVAPASARGAAGVQVSLMAAGQMQFPGTPFDGYRAAGADTDGAFAFSDVSPGQYTLLARASLPGLDGTPQIMWAASDLSIDGDSISGVPLVMASGMTISGRVRFVGTAKHPADLSSTKITLQPVQADDAVTIVPAGAAVDARGRFTLSGVTPGRYRLVATLSGRTAWALRSSIAGGVETLDAPLVLQPNQNITDAVITFVDRPAQLTGRLVTGSGAASTDYTIILFPADPSLWTPQSRRIQSARPSVDGSYRFDNLLPGTYLLGAVDDVEAGEWYDPAFLQRLVGSSMTLSIGESERRVQNVRVGR